MTALELMGLGMTIGAFLVSPLLVMEYTRANRLDAKLRWYTKALQDIAGEEPPEPKTSINHQKPTLPPQHRAYIALEAEDHPNGHS